MKNIYDIGQALQNVNEAIFRILNHYSCPPDCHAYCCKQFPVEVTVKEYKNLRKLSSEKTNNLKTVRYNGSKNYKLNTPCPFLENEESCTVYSVRPTRCRTFPFNMAEVIPPHMLIYPCMMGKKIYEDYFEYKIFNMKKDNYKYIDKEKLEISEVLGSLNEMLDSFYSNADTEIKMVGLNFQEIFDFSEYLNNTRKGFLKSNQYFKVQ